MKRTATILWALPVVLLFGGVAVAPGCAQSDPVPPSGSSGDEGEDGELTGGFDDTTDTEDKSGDPVPDETTSGSGSGGSASTGGTSSSGQGGSSAGTEACCTESDTAGCTDDATIESCVCAEDPFCCDTAWDATCVEEVTSLSCGTCSDAGGSTSGGSSGGGMGMPGDCCTPNPDAAGCTDTTVQDCVCAQDTYCCDTAWDDLCVEEVGTFMCGTCM